MKNDNNMVLRRWSEIHTLNAKYETQSVIKNNASYTDFENACQKDKKCPSIAFIIFKMYADGTVTHSVREIKFK